MSESGQAKFILEGCVATIWFDRQAARNAMLHATWLALPKLIAAAENDTEIDLIVLRGAGGNFGAGNDIAEFGSIRSDAALCKAYGRDMADAMMAVEHATKPVIAAIEGNCFGASVALTLAADFRVAATNARFAITPAKLGALYLRSDLHRLVAAIGQGQARRMIFTATALGASEAAAIGLVDHLLDTDCFDAELGQFEQAIVQGSSYTLFHTKRMLRGIGHGTTPLENDESLGWFVDAMQGKDFAEGVMAFMDKRSPMFSRSM
jgi:enoyl-CoA hydratase/carnithine racemase